MITKEVAQRTRTRLVALVGNPNTGKTTLFNELTGFRQRVGNYPGVTVEQKSGPLPGPYGPRTAEIVQPLMASEPSMAGRATAISQAMALYSAPVAATTSTVG